MSNIDKSPGSYFIIKVWVDKEECTYGPYLELKNAIALLVDHIPYLASYTTTKNKFSYRAEIQECLPSKKRGWSIISTPIVENKCRRWQPPKRD